MKHKQQTSPEELAKRISDPALPRNRMTPPPTQQSTTTDGLPTTDQKPIPPPLANVVSVRPILMFFIKLFGPTLIILLTITIVIAAWFGWLVLTGKELPNFPFLPKDSVQAPAKNNTAPQPNATSTEKQIQEDTAPPETAPTNSAPATAQ